MVESPTGLSGMKEICAYCGGWSETTVLKWIREYQFPAVKLGGSNKWISDKREVDEWRRKMVRGEVGSEE